MNIPGAPVGAAGCRIQRCGNSRCVVSSAEHHCKSRFTGALFTLHQWRVPQFALKCSCNPPPPPGGGDRPPPPPWGETVTWRPSPPSPVGGGALCDTGGDCKGGGGYQRLTRAMGPHTQPTWSLPEWDLFIWRGSSPGRREGGRWAAGKPPVPLLSPWRTGRAAGVQVCNGLSSMATADGVGVADVRCDAVSVSGGSWGGRHECYRTTCGPQGRRCRGRGHSVHENRLLLPPFALLRAICRLTGDPHAIVNSLGSVI